MKFKTVTQRFVVWFLLISLLPILLVGYGLLHTFEKELQQTVSRQISAIADTKSDQIDSYMGELVRIALIKTHGHTTRLAMADFASEFARTGSKSAAYRQLDARYRDYFSRLLNTTNYTELFLISPQGSVVYTQNQRADFATNLMTGPYRDTGLAKVTRIALKTLENGVSEFEFYEPSASAAAFVAAPIIIKGKVAGVLALQIDSQHVFRVLLDKTGLGESGETVVAKRLNKDSALLMAPLKFDTEAAFKRTVSLSDRVRAAPLLHALDGARGSAIGIDYAGNKVVVAWRYLPRMGWGMVTKMDAAEALAPYYRVRDLSLMVLALAFLSALTVAIVLGRRIVLPLKFLTGSAQAISSGNFEQRVAVAGRDELGQLAESFNTMADRLQSSYANLEEQVRQRTAELTRALTQEQNTKKALHFSEARLKDAQRIVQVGSWELDLVNGELRWSDEIFRLFEIEASRFDATYEGFLNAIHPEDCDMVNQAYTESLKNREPYEIEHRLLMTDGRIKWVQELCESEFDSTGKPLRSLGTVQDITERKLAAQALEASEALFRTLAEIAPVGIFHADAQGACTYVNEKYCAMSGQSQVEALGKGWGAAVYVEDRTRVANIWQQTVLGQLSFDAEFRLQRPDGQIVWIAGLARVERDSQGQLLGFVGALNDITERKIAEAILKDNNQELEQRVEVRTALLLAAKEEAEEANRSKSVFLSSMSHELRTPLNAILGYAQLMQINPKLPQSVIENAGEIKRAGDVLLSLMNDILDLSRIESGKLELNLETVPLSGVMKNCHAHNIQTALSHNVTLHMAESCTAFQVTADQRALLQVLNNLISNAIKYNSDGGRVTVSCGRVADGKVRISVSDTGIGIAPEMQAQLFQSFNRLGAEMGNIEGTGIGLVISRKLAEGMLGVMGVESVKGSGSTFWLELPVETVVSTAANSQAGGNFKKVPRVLVAEDYVPNQNVLLLQLQKLGCEVDIARDGAEALNIWRKKPYDLILTDIDMPIMNGVEFAQALRLDERRKGMRIPIVAITATNASSEMKRYREAGIDEVLSKPLSMDTLRDVMTRWLGDYANKTVSVQPVEDAAENYKAGAVLDLNYLYHILGQVNLVQARVLVDTFMRTADEGLQALSTQMDDAAVVAKEMHKQKSSARTVGALHYANLAAKLEQRTKDEHYAGIADSLAELRDALNQVEAASANLLESPRIRAAEPVAASNGVNLKAQSVLLVDDDLVVLHQVNAMLGALGMTEVYTAINGLEASKLLSEQGRNIEVLICDLSMPQMDGVELIRKLGQTEFKGGLILVSGADEKIISTVSKLAMLQGVRVLGQLQKPVSASQLAVLLAHKADFPASQRQIVAGPAVSSEAIVAAMEANEFSIWFQPKVDALTLQAVGIEALARWQLPGGKFIPPDNFITVAEREGVIGELSRLLVSISLSEAAKLFTAGFPLKVAINLSGTWLNDLNLPDFILSNTVSSGLRATDVILEVTETGVMEDLTTALDVLTRLRIKGFGLSIDDFGIGYSSFEQLGRIPFTEMKLDRSFVSKGVEDGAARAILESSMDMAHKLNLATVAEGVENELDLKLVRSLGCDLVQGYLIAKPMPVQDLIVWLENAKNRQK